MKSHTRQQVALLWKIDFSLKKHTKRAIAGLNNNNNVIKNTIRSTMHYISEREKMPLPKIPVSLYQLGTHPVLKYLCTEAKISPVDPEGQ